jgi:hypothetical protein
MTRWSKLQKELYEVRAEGLDLQIHCRRYRMASQRGSTDLPRYWITLGKEVIWDYPRDFLDKPHPQRNPPKWYPYGNDISAISVLLRAYLDTPRGELLTKEFHDDHWGLINILRAADRRVGARRIAVLERKTRNKAARLVLEARQSRIAESGTGSG